MSSPITLDDLLAAMAAMSAEVRALRDEVHQLRAAVPETLVDLKTAAQTMGVSPRTLRRYVEAGTVPFRRCGRVLRFPVSALKPPQVH